MDEWCHACYHLFRLHAFQQASKATDVGKSTSPETSVQALDLDCSTDGYITQLDDDKPTASVTYRVETNLLKQIRDTVFHVQLSLKHISDALFQTKQRQMPQANIEESRNSWLMVAMVIDRLLLLIFTLLTIIVSIVLLLNHPTYAYKHVNQPLDTLE